MKHCSFVAALVAFAPFLAAAQQEVGAYGQCGGSNYNGPTACVSGYHCEHYNDYYSQCIPGGSEATSTADPVTKVISSTAKSESTSSATSAQSTASPTETGSPSGTSPASYPATSGTSFVIDGEPGYFAGTNSYWIGFLTNDADVDLVMEHLQESGLKILRVWGFNDVTSTPSDGTVYYQSFAGGEPTINTGANGLQRLDYVVKSAEAHGIKLIINFVNNWTDYGGMAAYFDYAGISDNTQW
ncbi:hypothetical protein D0864_15612 [Hortaea werneckii]|nr:hypothetical protein D0864_15612 [Hortaea werneckii]